MNIFFFSLKLLSVFIIVSVALIIQEAVQKSKYDQLIELLKYKKQQYQLILSFPCWNDILFLMKLRQPLIYNYQIYDYDSSTMSRKHNKYFSQKQDVKKIQAYYPLKKKKSTFSHHEDKKILNLVLTYGPKFKKIAKMVGNRSVSIVKNHYYKELRYKWDQILGKKYGHFNCDQSLTQPDRNQIKIEEVKELFGQINFDSSLKQRFRMIFDYMDILDVSKWNFL